jgi:flagellar biosynthesis/type III secretory pathway protein FliH
VRACDAQVLERARVTVPVSEIVVVETPEPVYGTHLEDPVAAAYRDGLAKGRAEAEQSARQGLLDDLLNEVGELIFALVEELVGELLALHEEPVRVAIGRALRVAPPEIDLIVHLHPSAEIAAWELESLVPGRRIRVVEDPSVDEVGCVLEVGSATIDAQIEPALARLKASLTHLHNSPDVEEAS